MLLQILRIDLKRVSAQPDLRLVFQGGEEGVGLVAQQCTHTFNELIRYHNFN